jgi:hypothetical protein
MNNRVGPRWQNVPADVMGGDPPYARYSHHTFYQNIIGIDLGLFFFKKGNFLCNFFCIEISRMNEFPKKPEKTREKT